MAQESFPFLDFLLFLLPQVPFVLLWLVALILAMAFWSRHPRVSLLMVLASVLLIIRVLASSFFHFWIFRQQDWPRETTDMYLGIGNLFFFIMGFTAWVLVVIAVFGWRPRPIPVQLVPAPLLEEPMVPKIPPPPEAIRE